MVSVATQPTFTSESLMANLDALEPLAQQHAIELDGNSDVPLAIDRTAFAHWEKNGAIRCFLMRVGNQIAGYGVFLVVHHPFKPSMVEAGELALYLTPGWRKTGYGIRFIRWQDQQLQDEQPPGTKFLLRRHTKVIKDHGHLLQRHGYRAEETVYTKRFDKDIPHG